MSLDEVLKKLKKQYSENFSHLCRDLFPTLLEQPDEFYNLITDHFAPNEFLYEDVVADEIILNKFKNYIFDMSLFQEKQKQLDVIKTPAELLKEAGYTLYECLTKKEILKFRKYYAEREELCTFYDNRLLRCYVFFAVKDNVDEIKRENFLKPQRQDEYGTSVISIQFTKGNVNTLSIKNRYNHTVVNPDATFGNNLDNIIPGLTDAFNKHYHLNSKGVRYHFELPDYVKANDGKFYKYNYELDNTYFCPDNIVIRDFIPIKLDKEKYIVMDYYVLRLKHDQQALDLGYGFSSYFLEGFPESVGKINRVEVSNDKEKKHKTITINGDIKIVINNKNQIIGYDNPKVKYILSGFMRYNFTLESINLPNVERIDNDFLAHNNVLKKLDLPSVISISHGFLNLNNCLEYFEAPNLGSVGYCFLRANQDLKELSLPNLHSIDDNFLDYNKKISKISLPSVIYINDCFLHHNDSLVELNLPNVKKVGFGFLGINDSIKKVNMPEVETIGEQFMFNNHILEEINIPKVRKIEGYFLAKNRCLKHLYTPWLKELDTSKVLYSNDVLEDINGIKVVDGNIPKAFQEFLESNNDVEFKTYIQTINERSIRDKVAPKIGEILTPLNEVEFNKKNRQKS